MQCLDLGNDSSLALTGDLTIEAWVKIEGSSGEYLGIAGKMSRYPYAGFTLTREESDVFRLQVESGNDEWYVESDTAYADTDWHYVVGVIEGGNGYLYVDGVQQIEIEGDVTVKNSDGFAHIGRQYYDWDTRYWEGVLDEVRFSNSGRSIGWIKAQYLSMTDALITYGCQATD